MVGTPQLPLKYRRKGIPDFRIFSTDLDESSDSSMSPVNSCRFSSSEYSMPHSPTLHYSSSSSVAPSSPACALCTPEPPSSPAIELLVASSPNSSRSDSRRGFWDVAFNYGPDLPYKDRSVLHTPDFGHEQFKAQRRSSSASAPGLVSDVDPSEYSEDYDPFHMDDDTTVECSRPIGVTIVNVKNDTTVGGSEAAFIHRDDTIDARNIEKGLDGEIDVAAVLLDLRRQVRVTSVESKAVDIAINSLPAGPAPCPDSSQHELCALPLPLEGSPQIKEELTILTSALPESQVRHVSHECPQDIIPSNLVKLEPHDTCSVGGIDSTGDLKLVNDTPADIIKEQVAVAVVSEVSAILHGTSEDISASSDHVAGGDTGLPTTDIILSSKLEEGWSNVTEQVQDMDASIGLIFSAPLTPISSPALSGCEIVDFSEPLSEPPSPKTNEIDLTRPHESPENTPYIEGSNSLDTLPPVAGPSNHYFGSVDRHAGEVKCKISRPTMKFQKARPVRPVSDIKAEATDEVDLRTCGKKRSRSRSTTAPRSSSPTPSASCSDIFKPRTKRSKKATKDVNASRCDAEPVLTNLTGPSSSLHTPSILPAQYSPISPREASPAAAPLEVSDEKDDSAAKAEICGCLIQAMALSRASSMPASSLLRGVLRENPHLTNQRGREDWLSIISVVLGSHDVFGRVDRLGLDAHDKPLEAQWFYIPENDPDQDRATLLREMMPKKRNETKKHKQYFYKPLGKISRWDAEDAL